MHEDLNVCLYVMVTLILELEDISDNTKPDFPTPAAELVRKTPLFPGESELQQLLHIFR